MSLPRNSRMQSVLQLTVPAALFSQDEAEPGCPLYMLVGLLVTFICI